MVWQRLRPDTGRSGERSDHRNGGQRLLKIGLQVLKLFQADRQANHAVANAHGGPHFRPRLPKDGVRHRNDERARVGQARGLDGQLQAVAQRQALGGVAQFE